MRGSMGIFKKCFNAALPNLFRQLDQFTGQRPQLEQPFPTAFHLANRTLTNELCSAVVPRGGPGLLALS